jgi:hypothetical protein
MYEHLKDHYRLLRLTLLHIPINQIDLNKHHGHSHTHNDTPAPAAGTNATADALSASVLPVSTPFVGANTAHSLAQAAAEAPSTIPKAAGTGAAAASLEGHNKVIVVFKKDTPMKEIEAACKDVESKGSSFLNYCWCVYGLRKGWRWLCVRIPLLQRSRYTYFSQNDC